MYLKRQILHLNQYVSQSRSIGGSNSSGSLDVTWNSGAFDPVSMTVLHIGSGAISDVSNT